MRESIVIALLSLCPLSLYAKDSDGAGRGSLVNAEDLARIREYAPHPGYGFRARKDRLEGTGVFAMRVDLTTGAVNAVQIVHSTGHQLLDTLAVKSLLYWRFKPKEILARRDHPPPGIEVNPQFAVVRMSMAFVMKSKT